MILKIIFSDYSFIRIRLFDNKTIKKWFDFVREKNNQTNIFQFKYNATSRLYISCPQLFLRFTPSINIIKKSFKDLENIGYCVPLEFKQIDEKHIDQYFLNRLHRFFTYNAMWWFQQDTENPYDPNFKLSKNISIKDWHDLIEPINNSVHKLESIVSSTSNNDYVRKNHRLEIIEFWNKHTGNFDWLPFDDVDQMINLNFFSTPDKPTVFLSHNILGKPIIESFLTDDDPTAKDCTGRKGSYGSFCIDFINGRKKLYQSNKFKGWLEKYNLNFDEVPFEFPIGYVDHMSDTYINFKRKKNKFLKILFLPD